MTLDQILAFAIIGGMMVAFIWGRFRYDLVAAGALLAAVAAGIVKPDDAFAGFSDEIVIIVGSALVVSAAISRSGVTEAALRRFAPNISAPRSQLIVLVLIVTVLSAFVKNRRARHHAADRLPDGQALRRDAIDVPDAHGLRLAAGRPDDADRHVAEHHPSRRPC